MTAGAYTPTVFYKGSQQKIARTWAAHYKFVFDGWKIWGLAPGVSRSQIPAYLSDVDSLIEPVTDRQAELSMRGTLAEARNESGVATTASVDPAAAVAVPGCLVWVPALPSDVRLYLRWQVVWGITTAGAGRLQSGVYEIINGTPTVVSVPYTLTSASQPAAGAFGGIHQFSVNLGRSETPRSFGLYVNLARDGGSSLAAYTHNLPGDSVCSQLVAEGR